MQLLIVIIPASFTGLAEAAGSNNADIREVVRVAKDRILNCNALVVNTIIPFINNVKFVVYTNEHKQHLTPALILHLISAYAGEIVSLAIKNNDVVFCSEQSDIYC